MSFKKEPIIVIGSSRSGTTLLRLILTSHSDVTIPTECGFFVWWYEKYKDWSVDCFDNRLGTFLDDFFSSRKIDNWKLDRKSLEKHIRRHKPGDYASLVAEIYMYYMVSSNEKSRRWGDKNNHYLYNIKEIKEMFPKAHFVHIIRDGRDVAASYMKLNKANIQAKYAPNLPSEIEEIAERWASNLKTIRQSFSVFEWDRVLEVRYEDLVTKPERVVGRICKFLGLKFEKQMLEFYKENKEKKLVPDGFMKWKKRTFKEIDTSAVGKYKKELTEDERIKFEKLAGEILEQYNYI